MDALVIIDFQRTIANAPAARLEECRDLLAKAAHHARAKKMPVIFIQHEGEDEAWEKGSEGWKFFDELSPQGADKVIAKRSCDSFRDTSLKATLDQLGVKGIVVGGYATDYCVDATVKTAAAQMGLKTTVLRDAHTCPDRRHLPAASIVLHHNIVWNGWDNPGNPIQLISTAEFLAR